MRSQGVNPLESAEERFRSLLSDNSWGRVSKGAEEIFKRLSGISAKDIASSSPIDGKTTFSQFGSLVNTQMQVSSPVKIEFDDIAKMDYLVLESGVRQLLSPALEEIHKIHLGWQGIKRIRVNYYNEGWEKIVYLAKVEMADGRMTELIFKRFIDMSAAFESEELLVSKVNLTQAVDLAKILNSNDSLLHPGVGPFGFVELYNKGSMKGKVLVSTEGYVRGKNLYEMLQDIDDRESPRYKELVMGGLRALYKMWKLSGYMIQDPRPYNIVVGNAMDAGDYYSIVDLTRLHKVGQEGFVADILSKNGMLGYVEEEQIVDNLKETKALKDEMSAAAIAYVIFISVIVVVISPLLFALSFNLLILIINFIGKLSVATQKAATLPFVF